MSWSTREQLRARTAELRRPALEREEQLLNARYAGQYVAYLDHWTEYELWRQVLAATPDRDEFERVLALLKASNGRVKGVGVPPAEPLPPTESRESIEAKLRAPTYKTPAQVEALRRADYKLCDDYPGQWVAWTDDWNGEELVRTVLVTGTEYGPFYEHVDKFPPDMRSRIRCTRMPEPGVVEVPSAWLE